MANIYTYYEAEWTYHNVTQPDETSFTFDGVGAFATTTIIGREFGVLGSELFLRGLVSPSQGRLTQGLLCRLDMYSKQDIEQEHWEVEKHFVYLKGDKNGAINQKVETIGGFHGFFDHIDIRLEVLPDSELSGEDTIELTSFAIEDPTLSSDIPEIKNTLIRHEIDLNKYGLELTEILGTEEEEGRLGVAEQNVANLTARELTFTETLTTGGVNLLENATYGGREAPDDSLWCADETLCYVLNRFNEMVVGEIDYPVLGESEQYEIPTYLKPSYLTALPVGDIQLYSITDGVSTTIQDELDDDGTLTRRVGIYEYTGEEDWQWWGGGEYAVYYVVRPVGAKIQGVVMSSHASYGLNNVEEIPNRTEIHLNGNIDFAFDPADTQGIEGFIDYLKVGFRDGKPLTVYYELDTPIIETVRLPSNGNVLDVLGNLTITEVLGMGW